MTSRAEFAERCFAALAKRATRDRSSPSLPSLASLPTVVRHAVERAGGADACNDGLIRILTVGPAIQEALWSTWSDADDQLGMAAPEIESVAQVSPLVVVEPHVGAALLVAFHFNALGLEIGSFTISGKTDAALGHYSFPRSPIGALAAHRWLRRPGRVFLWQPDGWVYSQGRRAVALSFLGREQRVTTTMAHMAIDAGAPVYLAWNRLRQDPLDGFDLSISCITDDLEAWSSDDLTRQMMAAAESCILENIDQWRGWDYARQEQIV